MFTRSRVRKRSVETFLSLSIWPRPDVFPVNIEQQRCSLEQFSLSALDVSSSIPSDSINQFHKLMSTSSFFLICRQCVKSEVPHPDVEISILSYMM